MTNRDAIVSHSMPWRLHKLRSGLTMRGLIIGVAAVIAMVAVGGGAREQVVAQIRILGSICGCHTGQRHGRRRAHGFGRCLQAHR